jgi:hypothetical protein
VASLRFRGAPTEPSSSCGRKIMNKYEQRAAVSRFMLATIAVGKAP